MAEALRDRSQVHRDQRLILDDQDVGRELLADLAAGLPDELYDPMQIGIERNRRR